MGEHATQNMQQATQNMQHATRSLYADSEAESWGSILIQDNYYFFTWFMGQTDNKVS